MKKYIKSNDEYTISKDNFSSLVKHAVDEFTRYVESIVHEYNPKYAVKFDIWSTELVFESDDSDQYKVTLKDQDGKYFDLYIELMMIDDRWMLVSDVYDYADDYYEQARMYLDK